MELLQTGMDVDTEPAGLVSVIEVGPTSVKEQPEPNSFKEEAADDLSDQGPAHPQFELVPVIKVETDMLVQAESHVVSNTASMIDCVERSVTPSFRVHRST